MKDYKDYDGATQLFGGVLPAAIGAGLLVQFRSWHMIFLGALLLALAAYFFLKDMIVRK